MDRRKFLAASIISALPVKSADASARGTAGSDADHVDPFIGTGAHGHTYPGATLPGGMVQLSPDTDTARWDASSGYHASDTTIVGFSHTHLSGTGIGDMLDLLVMPAIGPVQLQPGRPDQPGSGYRQKFRQADEVATPGFYQVRLANRVLCELTATVRTGLHRYCFPKGAGHLLIDWSHAMQDSTTESNQTENTPAKPPPVGDAMLQLLPDGTLTGSRKVFSWANGRQVHFALKTSRPFDTAQLYAEDTAQGDGVRSASGKYLKAGLHWQDAGDAPVIVQVGISIVDVAGALANLNAEDARAAFEPTRARAARTWDAALQRIAVVGGTADQRTAFATAVYHSLLAPTHIDDSDGRYRGLDDAVHRVASGSHAYSTYSFWDTFRALHPLLTLAYPDHAQRLVHDIVAQGAQSPVGPLVWPLQARETATMIGWHSAVVLAEARTKGFAADWARAWTVFREVAFGTKDERLPQYAGLTDYRHLGYCAADRVWESVSRTLEYAYDDWAMAVLADAAAAPDDAKRLRARSKNWHKHYDAGTGFMRPRAADGSWITPFEPRALGHKPGWRDYTESNAWPPSFGVQHDVHDLIALVGGDGPFVAHLDRLFTATPGVAGETIPDLSGTTGQYVHGNEPSHHIAYLYAYAGQQWRTAARVRQIMATNYHAGRDGLSGNDDCGQMSAWFVLSALGLYPVDPVSGVWVIGSPLFTRATVQVAHGALVIEAPGNGPDTPFVQQLFWNGRPHLRSWIAHHELAAGGNLHFVIGPRPNTAFGQLSATRPPSFTIQGLQ